MNLRRLVGRTLFALLHDNGAGNAINSRIVIFSSDANLRHLASADRWFGDGNFKLVPGIFQQLYVIRVRLGDTYITALYVYLQHKNQVVYTEMWSVVQREFTQRNLIINVRHLVVDFEKPVLNTFDVFGV